MVIYQALTDLLGVTLPAGYEVVGFICSFIILIFLLSVTFSILFSLLKWIGGK